MQSDFKIKDGSHVEIAGDLLDLHNHYDFTAVDYSIAERSVRLSWTLAPGEWVVATDPLAITIEYTEVSRFEFLPRDSDIPFSEDDCLSSAGYWTDEYSENGVFWTEAQPEPEWLTAFRFMSGAIILIQAATAHVMVKR